MQDSNAQYPFVATPTWHSTFPGAIVAAFGMSGVANPSVSEHLDVAKRALEDELRARWSGKARTELRADPILAIYDAYTKRFGQNYHVQMQIESVALKGKSIPSRAALVEAMFMTELATGVLTAVQDFEELRGEVVVDVATGEELYTRFDGAQEKCKASDMYMRDDVGVLTSIAQGPTALALVTPTTTAALFCVYAPAGIERETVDTHFDFIEQYVRLISPGAVASRRTIIVG